MTGGDGGGERLGERGVADPTLAAVQDPGTLAAWELALHPLIFAEGASFGSLLARVLFLLGFDAVFLVAAYGTYDFAIGE